MHCELNLLSKLLSRNQQMGTVQEKIEMSLSQNSTDELLFKSKNTAQINWGTLTILFIMMPGILKATKSILERQYNFELGTFHPRLKSRPITRSNWILLPLYLLLMPPLHVLIPAL